MPLLDRIDDRESLGQSLKCRVYAGRLDGVDVVAKVLEHTDPVWRWYYEREVAVLPLLESVGAPRFITADHASGVLITTRARGTPLARNRMVSETVPDAVIDSTLAASDRVAAIDLSRADVEPPAAVRAAMRERLLEDPTAPLDWVLEGVERCARLRLITRTVAVVMVSAIEAGGVVSQHGDLLPRNVLVVKKNARPGVALIDWECAGRHPRDWDRALFWANVDSAGRARIERSIGTDPERNRGFRAMCAFALAREVKFARTKTANRSRRERDLAAAVARL